MLNKGQIPEVEEPSAPTLTQVGLVKVVMTTGESELVGGVSDIGSERARNFLKEHLYGSRLKRVPGIYML